MRIISYWKNIKIRTPHRYSMDIQSLRAGFSRGGGNVTAQANCPRLPQIAHVMAQVENGGKLRWNSVGWSHVTKGIVGSLATSALAAFLIFEQPTAPPVFFSFP